MNTPGKRRKPPPKKHRTAEEQDIHRRAGKITDAWTATQAAGLVDPNRRASVHRLVSRVLQGGQFTDDAVEAALLRLADRGIAPTAAALGRELTKPSLNGQARNGPHQNYQEPADKSVYKKGFRDAYQQ